MGWLFAGIAVFVLFIVYLFLILPERADKAKFAPFQCLMAAHRGLYEKDQSVPENWLLSTRTRSVKPSAMTPRCFSSPLVWAAAQEQEPHLSLPK